MRPPPRHRRHLPSRRVWSIGIPPPSLSPRIRLGRVARLPSWQRYTNRKSKQTDSSDPSSRACYIHPLGASDPPRRRSPSSTTSLPRRVAPTEGRRKHKEKQRCVISSVMNPRPHSSFLAAPTPLLAVSVAWLTALPTWPPSDAAAALASLAMLPALAYAVA